MINANTLKKLYTRAAGKVSLGCGGGIKIADCIAARAWSRTRNISLQARRDAVLKRKSKQRVQWWINTRKKSRVLDKHGLVYSANSTPAAASARGLNCWRVWQSMTGKWIRCKMSGLCQIYIASSPLRPGTWTTEICTRRCNACNKKAVTLTRQNVQFIPTNSWNLHFSDWIALLWANHDCKCDSSSCINIWYAM